MKTIQNSPKEGSTGGLGVFLSSILAVILFTVFAASASADIPDRNRVQLDGMYKVESSTDPIFPMAPRAEWFLDFGNSMQQGETSGKVAISLRENPDVKVKILVWQYYPDRNVLVIGTPAADGSGRAVPRGIWTVTANSSQLGLYREDVSVVMNQAGPNDY
ncbi:hypothetical protein [Luteolibacter sp. AS25]|uniref:hypothetical protein n=1 Tax=Luteolibacter sp. AS25 TaxID=3135776 RepID=UPI00398B791D